MHVMDPHRWLWRARLIYIVDADTFDLELDRGFNKERSIHRFRLYEVDAPERYSDAGQQATSYIIAWFTFAYSGGGNWPLQVETYKPAILPDGSFGRWQARVWRRIDEAELGADLVEGGHVKSE